MSDADGGAAVPDHATVSVYRADRNPLTDDDRERLTAASELFDAPPGTRLLYGSSTRGSRDSGWVEGLSVSVWTAEPVEQEGWLSPTLGEFLAYALGQDYDMTGHMHFADAGWEPVWWTDSGSDDAVDEEE